MDIPVLHSGPGNPPRDVTHAYSNTSVHMCIYIYIYVYVCVCVCLCMQCPLVSMVPACTHTYVQSSIHMYTYVHMYVCVCSARCCRSDGACAHGGVAGADAVARVEVRAVVAAVEDEPTRAAGAHSAWHLALLAPHPDLCVYLYMFTHTNTHKHTHTHTHNAHNT